MRDLFRRWWESFLAKTRTCANGWHDIVDDGWDPYHVYRCYKCTRCTWYTMRSLHELIPGVPLRNDW